MITTELTCPHADCEYTEVAEVALNFTGTWKHTDGRTFLDIKPAVTNLRVLEERFAAHYREAGH